MSNNETIKPLALEIEGRGVVRGWHFRQISRTDKGFVYECTHPGTLTHYEVFERVINRRFNRESYPGNEAFGHWAWTFNSLEMATDKLNKL